MCIRDSYGGAIFLNGTLQSKKGGTVNLYGGTISNNSAKIGGAIYAVYGGTVNLFGGEISGNKATANGGGAILSLIHILSRVISSQSIRQRPILILVIRRRNCNCRGDRY